MNKYTVGIVAKDKTTGKSRSICITVEAKNLEEAIANAFNPLKKAHKKRSETKPKTKKPVKMEIKLNPPGRKRKAPEAPIVARQSRKSDAHRMPAKKIHLAPPPPLGYMARLARIKREILAEAKIAANIAAADKATAALKAELENSLNAATCNRTQSVRTKPSRPASVLRMGTRIQYS